MTAKNRTEKRMQKTRQQIVKTAMQLILTQGYEETSMEQIAAQSDVAKGTLYHHFPVKEAILNEWMRQHFEEHKADRLAHIRALPDTRSRLQVIFEDLLAGILRSPQIFERYMVYRMKLTLSFEKVADQQSGLDTLVGEILTLGIASGELRLDLPLWLMAEALDFSFIAAVQPLFENAEHYDPQATLNQCLDLFLQGAAARRE